MADQRSDGIIGNNHGIRKEGRPYIGLIEKMSKKWGIPEVLVSHQIYRESSFRPDVISSAGAVGLMQLLPSTAREVGERHNLPWEPLTSAEVNVDLGLAYMRELYAHAYQYFPDPEDAYRVALAAYYTGPANISKISERGMTETQEAYVGGTPEYPGGIIEDYERTESWNQLKPPDGLPGKGFPWWLVALAAGGYYVYQRKK